MLPPAYLNKILLEENIPSSAFRKLAAVRCHRLPGRMVGETLGGLWLYLLTPAQLLGLPRRRSGALIHMLRTVSGRGVFSVSA